MVFKVPSNPLCASVVRLCVLSPGQVFPRDVFLDHCCLLDFLCCSFTFIVALVLLLPVNQQI